jgi:hypothetical protein
MPEQRPKFLGSPAVRAALRQAWEDSHPGVGGGREEGGFILRDAAAGLHVSRWLHGEQDTIVVPAHPNCKLGQDDIVGTFHTHPNTGSDYLQEPSETDQLGVRDDLDLKGPLYEGELVISQQKLYLISPDGDVSELGDTQETLAEDE